MEVAFPYLLGSLKRIIVALNKGSGRLYIAQGSGRHRKEAVAPRISLEGRHGYITYIIYTVEVLYLCT